MSESTQASTSGCESRSEDAAALPTTADHTTSLTASVVAPPRIETGWQWFAATVLFAGIVLFYTIAAMRAPMVYIWATYEDLFGEWCSSGASSSRW